MNEGKFVPLSTEELAEVWRAVETAGHPATDEGLRQWLLGCARRPKHPNLAIVKQLAGTAAQAALDNPNLLASVAKTLFIRSPK